jgi:uncharacterized Zn-finger protein
VEYVGNCYMNCLTAAEERSRLENIVEEASGVYSEENSKNELLTTCSDLVSADSDKCLTGFANLKLNQHRTSDDEQLTQRVNEYVCDMCNKVFTHRCYLMRHKKYGIPCGTNIKPYACDICGKACRNRAEVLVHMRTHTGERPFVCTVCGKAFRRQTELTNHCHTHSEVKRFSCTICDKAYKDQTEYIRHMRTHTGEKRYACTMCNQAYFRRSLLTVYMRKHTNG